jgi:hypothetical protein
MIRILKKSEGADHGLLLHSSGAFSGGNHLHKDAVTVTNVNQGLLVERRKCPGYTIAACGTMAGTGKG